MSESRKQIEPPQENTPKRSLMIRADYVRQMARGTKDKHGKGCSGRSVAIAVTHLETAELWLKRAAEEEPV